MKKNTHLVKYGNKIKGFVYIKPDGSFWYGFGKPCDENIISFKCRSIEHGIACVEMKRF